MEANFLNLVFSEILGTELTPVVLVTAYIFAFAGMFLRWWWLYDKKGKTDPQTPVKFNLVYWLRDNLSQRLMGVFASVILIFLSLRLSHDWFGAVVSYGYAFMVGLSLDYIASVVKKFQFPIKQIN